MFQENILFFSFQCKLCNKRFTTIYNLNSHMKGHSRPCSEECPVESCGLKFQTRRELDKHLKTHEGVEKTYKYVEFFFSSPELMVSYWDSAVSVVCRPSCVVRRQLFTLCTL